MPRKTIKNHDSDISTLKKPENEHQIQQRRNWIKAIIRKKLKTYLQGNFNAEK